MSHDKNNNVDDNSESSDNTEAKFHQTELLSIKYRFAEPPCETLTYENHQYRRTTNCGRGAFSYCFRYENKAKTKSIVAKVSPVSLINDKKSETMLLKMWDKEVNFLKSLNHENIVKMYKTEVTPYLRYIFMEYLPMNLNDEYSAERKSPMELVRIRRYMADIFSGLKYIHELKIVHRDIKMSNILLTADKRAKICDFGLSTRLIGVECMVVSKANACGTSNYMPPELLSANGLLTTKADVWSAGVIMYALFVGRLPFNDAKRKNVFVRIANSLFEIPNHIRQHHGGNYAHKLLETILHINPLIRPSAEDILQDPFFTNTYNGAMTIANEVPDCFGTNARDLLQQFVALSEDNKGANKRKRPHNHSQKYETGQNIWLVGHLKAALKIGFAYALSDGKIGIIFNSGKTLYVCPNQAVQSIPQMHRLDGSEIDADSEEEREKKIVIFNVFRDELRDMYNRTIHIRTDCIDPSAIISGFYSKKCMRIVLFTHCSLQLCVQLRVNNKPFEMLIGGGHVHLFNSGSYITYKRNCLPTSLCRIIDDIITSLTDDVENTKASGEI